MQRIDASGDIDEVFERIIQKIETLRIE